MMQTPSMIPEALECIYRYYTVWASRRFAFACRRGCTACCTRNVTMSKAEGSLLLAGLEHSQRVWLVERLQRPGLIGRPVLTTNDWARACLQGEEEVEENDPVLSPCPFLEADQSCGIYAQRPFVCRCFASTNDCSGSGSAGQPGLLLEVNTVTMQLVEHLSRGKLWGNMLDLLPLLLIREYPEIPFPAGDAQPAATLRAQALPGFLIMPEEQEQVTSYLNGLLAQRTGGRTLGEFLGLSGVPG